MHCIKQADYRNTSGAQNPPFKVENMRERTTSSILTKIEMHIFVR